MTCKILDELTLRLISVLIYSLSDSAALWQRLKSRPQRIPKTRVTLQSYPKSKQVLWSLYSHVVLAFMWHSLVEGAWDCIESGQILERDAVVRHRLANLLSGGERAASTWKRKNLGSTMEQRLEASSGFISALALHSNQFTSSENSTWFVSFAGHTHKEG